MTKKALDSTAFLIAADSIVDAVSFIRCNVLWSENNFSPNLALVRFEFLNPARAGSGQTWKSNPGQSHYQKLHIAFNQVCVCICVEWDKARRRLFRCLCVSRVSSKQKNATTSKKHYNFQGRVFNFAASWLVETTYHTAITQAEGTNETTNSDTL